MSDIGAANSTGERRGGSWLSTLGWAAYLGCSWTWCIGMFLPVLLVRDYGIWGFVVFAVPNVVGAGAMGWVLKQGTSERIVEKHRSACISFSMVTIAFQAFFLAWLPVSLLDRLETVAELEGGFTSLWWFGLAAALALAGLCVRPGSQAVRLIAAIVLSMSAVAGIMLLRGAGMTAWHASDAKSLAQVENFGVVWLSPVCAFGFALCPYLDLTFHRTRQALDERKARVAFTFGFGVFFFSMILVTLLYTPLVLGLLGMIPASSFRWLAVWPLLLHLLMQLVYTILVHTEEIAIGRRTVKTLIAIVVVCGFAFLARGLEASQWHGMLVGEIIYRCFMSFYGLIFPAYVWLCMIPTPDDHSGIDGPRGRRKLIVLIAAVALAAPCFWMGFIERVEWWLAPGLGIVLISRLLVRSMPNSRQLEN